MESEMSRELATFAAGCFWGVELEFGKMPGVLGTRVGYTGGRTSNPGYYEVCDGDTGHAEAVLIEFDPSAVSFETLVREFFNLHDPTTLNRQGPDVGEQYRSAIFYHSPEQKATAERVITELTEMGEFDRPIVTELVPAGTFWDAEEYHQKYFERRGMASCHIRRK
jgi:peptide-methionine (S)-S-oxide reductase